MADRTPAMAGRLGVSTDPDISSPLLPQVYSLLFPPNLSSPQFKKKKQTNTSFSSLLLNLIPRHKEVV